MKLIFTPDLLKRTLERERQNKQHSICSLLNIVFLFLVYKLIYTL